MKKILYGIQGTGNGHLARARALAPALREAGFTLDFVFSGRSREDFFNMEDFGEFTCFPGLSLVIQQGKLKLWKTIVNSNFLQLLKDIKKIDVTAYDLVISDFEPMTAWASYGKKIPVLGISHQSAFFYKIPKTRGFWASKLFMQSFAPASLNIGLHWHHFDQPILPPLIESLRKTSVIKNKILVYMAFEEIDDIIEFLKPHTDCQFYIFTKICEKKDLGHIQIRPFSHEDFHTNLENCSGVISNAGFELSSECMALGKKLLLKPVEGQYEQISNALAMQMLNRATVISSLDKKVLKQWLQLPEHAAINYPDVAKRIAQWIKNGQQQSISELAQSLWQECDFPLEYEPKFKRRSH